MTPDESFPPPEQQDLLDVDALSDLVDALAPVEPMEEGAQDLRPRVPVFAWDPATAVTGGVEHGRDGDSAARIGRAMKRLRAGGCTRPLCMPPPAWPQLIEEREARFPNFVDVIRSVIRPHVALSARGLPHRMAPVLLVGPPGIGKTYFAQGLCEVLGTPPPLVISMASETNGSALGGSSTFWSNSSPGALFESLAWGFRGGPAVANGLVVLDEVDKVSARGYDPLGALYDLLEADTAEVFVDQSLPDVTIDASRLRVVCTANDLAAIPLPIQSRTLIFEIEAPAPEQAAGVVQNIFEGVVARLGAPMSLSLPQAVVDEAVRVEPRQARMLLEGAVANALTAGRYCVEPQDWRAVRGSGRVARRGPMGFVGQP